MPVSRSLFTALIVRDWFDLPWPISLDYVWSRCFLYLVDYLSHFTHITIPSVLLVMVILSRVERHAPLLFLAVFTFSVCFYHLVLKWFPFCVPILYLYLIYLLGGSDFIKFLKGIFWSSILGTFLLLLYGYSPFVFYSFLICLYLRSIDISFSYYFYFMAGLFHVLFIHILVNYVSPFMFIIIFVYVYYRLCFCNLRLSLRLLFLDLRRIFFILLDCLFAVSLIYQSYYYWVIFLNWHNAFGSPDSTGSFPIDDMLDGAYHSLCLYVFIYLIHDVNSRSVILGFSGRFRFCLFFTFVIGPVPLFSLFLLWAFVVSKKNFRKKIELIKKYLERSEDSIAVKIFRDLLVLELRKDFANLIFCYWTIIYVREREIGFKLFNYSDDINIGGPSTKNKLVITVLLSPYKFIKWLYYYSWPQFVYDCISHELFFVFLGLCYSCFSYFFFRPV